MNDVCCLRFTSAKLQKKIVIYECFATKFQKKSKVVKVVKVILVIFIFGFGHFAHYNNKYKYLFYSGDFDTLKNDFDQMTK